ncbi:hypothetical protein JZK55_20390 [Dissulfurispira thermophila]|uniref:Uncharacterized protein n=2 Tax=root TaxID=1 RepID=A0A7G1H5U4_9BACT|nr:tetratricopeptide repeat protein [Dissulfurispira thermophila]BCB97117.1 hypothetical protein JZK55_20390 [Dissulfurispira thermophila]
MSLLADLLSKVKYTGHKADVPPNLKNVVSTSIEKQAIKKRILMFSVFILLAIATGVGTIYFVELYTKPPAKIVKSHETIARNQLIEVREETKEKEINVSRTIDNTQHTTLNARSPKPKPTKEIQQQKEIPKPKTEEKKIAEGQMPEPKAEDVQKDTEKKLAITQEPQPKQQDSQRDVYLYMARTYESKKDYYQALLNYKKALEIDANNYIIMSNISSVLIHLESFEEAITYAKNAIAIKRDFVPSLINIGIAYIRLDNSSEGEAYLLKALSIEPSNKYALLNLGLLYEKKGDNEKAYAYFSKLSEIGNIQGHLGIARIAEKQGKKSDAVRIYREILSMNNIDTKTRKLVNDRLLQLEQ